MKRPSPSAECRRLGRAIEIGTTAADRPEPRIKSTKHGRRAEPPLGRDGILDLPPPKRETCPAPPVARRIARIVLASRLPGANPNAKARASMNAIGLSGAEQDADTPAAVERWLRQPVRCELRRFGRDVLPFDAILRRSFST